MNGIKLVTFKTNHTIMGDVSISEDAISEDEVTVTIKQPVQIISVPPSAKNPEGGGIAFAPFLEFSEEWTTGLEFEIYDILTINTPVVELLNQYNSIFGSGIQIAGANDLTNLK